jgi:hypothetical protein
MLSGRLAARFDKGSPDDNGLGLTRAWPRRDGSRPGEVLVLVLFCLVLQPSWAQTNLALAEGLRSVRYTWFHLRLSLSRRQSYRDLLLPVSRANAYRLTSCRISM